MTYVGKGDALIGMGRIDEAAQVINAALNAASRNNAAGYQAQLQLQLAAVAQARKDPRAALDAMTQAATFAREAGAGRLVAEVALRRAEAQRALGDATGADRSLQEGTAAARTMHERFLLPQLLAARADLHVSRKQSGPRPARHDCGRHLALEMPMIRTVEAVIDENGNVKLLEPIRPTSVRRALVTILEEEPIAEAALLSEAALADDWNRPEEDEAWAHLQSAR